MAAGLSNAQIASRVRTRLQRIAREQGGQYVNGTKCEAPHVEGETEDGIVWIAAFAVGRFSNGEVAGMPIFSLTSGELSKSYSGLHGDLPTAIEAFRAERDGSIVYVVAYGGRDGAELSVGQGSITKDLGRARWAQQQSGNLANLWIARQLSPDTVLIIREEPYSGKASLDAMGAFITANGLDIWDAQRSLASSPALAILDLRTRAAA